MRPTTQADLYCRLDLILLSLGYQIECIMEHSEDTPVYFVNDFDDDWSDAHSTTTTTSGFTDHSMITLTSEEASGTPLPFMPTFRLTRIYLEYFQQIHGRAFPLAPNAPIFFPTDDIEVQRLDSVFPVLKLILNGNYYGPVKDVLSETTERRKRVLDLPTFEGNW